MNEYAHTAGHTCASLKGQSQCRSTIEAIAEMKKTKPIAFLKQSNIAAGNQQANNGTTATARVGAFARENEIPQNKLFTDTQHETLDIGSARPTSGTNPAMETVEAINSAAHKSG